MEVWYNFLLTAFSKTARRALSFVCERTLGAGDANSHVTPITKPDWLTSPIG
ncbi:hypothetical protein DPMN_140723 [Dreissena polymorpha]|uniref:Uncharacterized protein n=1 Tax=Dreissena polymorpha TaxID=45954 RepID=A0A9D4GC20_DREPO|nr:hypothetical protein DPMN_140723 [Dreissena polymorpha]